MRDCYPVDIWVTNMFLNDWTVEKKGQHSFLEKAAVPNFCTKRETAASTTFSLRRNFTNQFSLDS